MLYARTALSMAIVVLCLTTVATADVYRYRGPDGRLIISNMPPPPSAAVERSHRETVSQEVPTQVTEPAAEPAAAAPAPVVVVKEVPAKREEPQMDYREYKRRYNEAHLKYGNLDGMHIDSMMNRYRSHLLNRDSHNDSTRGREAIAECERKYNNDRSRLACLTVHYGG